MSAKDILSLFSIAGLLIAFISGLIPQFFKTSQEEGHRKYLTRPGMVALAVSALGLLTAMASAVMGISVRHQDELAAADVAREKAREEAETRRQARLQRAEDAEWRERSEQLAAKILTNTDQQLSASERTVASMLEGFRQDQLRHQQTFAELQRSTNRILMPTGRLAYSVSVRYLCNTDPAPPPCAVKSRVAPGITIASKPAHLVDSDGPAVRLTLYFALPVPGEPLTLSGSMIGGTKVSIYGRVQAILQDRNPPDLFVHVRPEGMTLSTVRSSPAIPPFISKDFASMVDLEGRTFLVWGQDIGEADAVTFRLESPNDVSLTAECKRAGVTGPGFRFRDDSYHDAVTCTFGTIF